MAANLHALGLILVILLTVAVTCRYGSRPETQAQVLRGILIPFGPVILYGLWSASVCICGVSVGIPVFQWLIPCTCLSWVLITTRPNLICTTASVALAASALAFTFQYLYLVHGERYIGVPERLTIVSRVRTKSHLWEIKRALAALEKEQNRTHPRGWLTESNLERLLPPKIASLATGNSVEAYPLWHSPLTGLYGKRHHQLALWYPGGPLKKGIRKLEFRSR